MNSFSISQPATLTGLVSKGESPTSSGVTPARFSGREYVMDGVSGHKTGVWESTPGVFHRSLPNAELMNFVLGSCTFTPDGKAPHQLRAGDTLFLPENTKGVWVVHETVRKVYVLFEHKPKAD